MVDASVGETVEAVAVPVSASTSVGTPVDDVSSITSDGETVKISAVTIVDVSVTVPLELAADDPIIVFSLLGTTVALFSGVSNAKTSDALG